MTGSATYTLNPSNSFEFAAGGNAGSTNINTLRTPLLQNNSEIYNLIYTYNADPWIIQPYFQATHVPTNTKVGITSSASTFGGALLVKYDVGRGINLEVRVEYIGTTGGNNLLYGQGSGAFSFTLRQLTNGATISPAPSFHRSRQTASLRAMASART